MTNNGDRDQLCLFTQQLIVEYEASRDPDSTEISQQFAVKSMSSIGDFNGSF